MAEHKYIVKVRTPGPGTYNPSRPITSLVRNQILHLSLVERHLPKQHRSGIDVYSIKTEAQASKYIHLLTRKLHPQSSRPGKATAKRAGKSTKDVKTPRKAIRARKVR
jgi:hypothetical protein